MPADEIALFGPWEEAQFSFPVIPRKFPDPPIKFPDPLSREFGQKPERKQGLFSPKSASGHPKSPKFPVFSLMIREFGAESSSHQTGSSTIKSLDFRTSGRIDQNRRVCARFTITRGPGEPFRRRKSPESAKTYPGAICLGPQVIAIHSPRIRLGRATEPPTALAIS